VAQDAFGFDRYLVEQLFRPVVNLYRVTPLAAGDTPAGGPVAFVRQKRMALKEDIRFFADEEETVELFRIKARRVLEVGGRYEVTEPDGRRIGVLEHQFGRSLLRSTWRILDADENEVPLAVAQERSLFFAILRRVIDFVPYVGEFIPVPYNFELRSGDRVVGGVDRKLQLRDRYVLDVSGDNERRIDRRLAISLAVGLDTLQNR
jgi:uncharacterized protein YxjI